MLEHLNLEGLQADLPPPLVVAAPTYKDGDKFLDFPRLHGLNVNAAPNEYNHKKNETLFDGYKPFDQILQSWLFFGLIREVTEVYVDSSKLSSGFRRRTSTNQYGPHQLSMEPLREIIKVWSQEFGDERRSDVRDRHMLRVHHALKTARAIVRKHYSVTRRGPASGGILFPLNQKLGLSLMILGETLSHAARRIFRNRPQIEGSYPDLRESWGRSELIDELLERATYWCRYTSLEFCKRFQYRNLAILQAIEAQRKITTLDPPNVNRQHNFGDCEENRCDLIHRFGPLETRDPSCLPRCSGCERLGPNVERLNEIVRDGKIPILLYHPRRTPKLEVRPYSEGRMLYGIISHVWAEGYCNSAGNNLPECHLKLFRECLENTGSQYARPLNIPLEDAPPTAFWMDALAIPLNRTLQREAIKNMREIFLHATHTVVIANDLLATNLPDSYEEISFRIATSLWTRRLWTLQEAYLSREIYFCFGDRSKSLDVIEDSLAYDPFDEISLADSHVGSLFREEARECLDIVLSHERKLRIQNDRREAKGRCTAALLANVWRAVQGRGTACEEHEALALSTLLGAERLTDEISGGFILEARPDGRNRPTKEQLERLMRRLLQSLNHDYPGCIPAGMIFLPEPKMTAPGWGWAPISWMTSSDPQIARLVSMSSQETTLTAEGLHVQFPGFLLHPLTDQEFPIETSPFPRDINMQEWYVVRRDAGSTNPRPPSVSHGVPVDPEIQRRRMAIIVQEMPILTEKIALLVYLRDNDRRDAGRHANGVMHVIWARRIIIQQETDEEKLRDFRKQHRERSLAFFGQALDASQRWCVDGPPRTYGMSSSQTDRPSNTPEPSQIPVSSDNPRPSDISGPSDTPRPSTATRSRVPTWGTAGRGQQTGGRAMPGPGPSSTQQRSTTGSTSAPNARGRDHTPRPGLMGTPSRARTESFSHRAGGNGSSGRGGRQTSYASWSTRAGDGGGGGGSQSRS